MLVQLSGGDSFKQKRITMDANVEYNGVLGLMITSRDGAIYPAIFVKNPCATGAGTTPVVEMDYDGNVGNDSKPVVDITYGCDPICPMDEQVLPERETTNNTPEIKDEPITCSNAAVTEEKTILSEDYGWRKENACLSMIENVKVEIDDVEENSTSILSQLSVTRMDNKLNADSSGCDLTDSEVDVCSIGMGVDTDSKREVAHPTLSPEDNSGTYGRLWEGNDAYADISETKVNCINGVRRSSRKRRAVSNAECIQRYCRKKNNDLKDSAEDRDKNHGQISPRKKGRAGNNVKIASSLCQRKRNPFNIKYIFLYQFICSSCHGVFQSYHEFMNHVSTETILVTEEYTNGCDNVKSFNAEENGYPVLGKCEARNMSFLCSLCGIFLENFDDFLSHVHARHPGLFQANGSGKGNSRSCVCYVCGQQTDCPAKMNNHINLHTRAHSCSYCDYSAQKSHNLRRHMIAHHPESGLTSERVECKICGKQIVDPLRLIAHVKFVHLGMDRVPHQCSQCGIVVSGKRGLKTHTKEMHSRARQYHCDWENCDKFFKSNRHLTQHYRIHTGEKPLSCSICGFSCCQKASLNWHFKSKHPDKPVSAIRSYSRHIETVQVQVKVQDSDAKKYLKSMYSTSVHMQFQCECCNIKCKTANNLAWHLRKQHSVDVSASSLKPLSPSARIKRPIPNLAKILVEKK